MLELPCPGRRRPTIHTTSQLLIILSHPPTPRASPPGSCVPVCQPAAKLYGRRGGGWAGSAPKQQFRRHWGAPAKRRSRQQKLPVGLTTRPGVCHHPGCRPPPAPAHRPLAMTRTPCRAPGRQQPRLLKSARPQRRAHRLPIRQHQRPTRPSSAAEPGHLDAEGSKSGAPANKQLSDVSANARQLADLRSHSHGPSTGEGVRGGARARSRSFARKAQTGLRTGSCQPAVRPGQERSCRPASRTRGPAGHPLAAPPRRPVSAPPW